MKTSIRRTKAALGVLILGMLFEARAQDFLINGLVACFPLQGSFADASGQGLSATNEGVIFTTGRFGYPDSAGSFDGTTRVVVPDFTSTNLIGVFTLAAWVKPSADSLNSECCGIISQPRDVDGTGCRLGLANQVMELGLNSTNGINWNGDDNSALTADTWVFLTVTFDGTTARFYRDGAYSSAADCGTTLHLNTSARPLYIGDEGLVSLPARHFKGEITRARVYNRVLSDGEVAALYNYDQTPVGPCLSIDMATGGASVEVSMPTAAGTNYVVERAVSLASPVWTPVLTNAGTGGFVTNTVPVDPGVAATLFRCRLQ